MKKGDKYFCLRCNKECVFSGQGQPPKYCGSAQVKGSCGYLAYLDDHHYRKQERRKDPKFVETERKRCKEWYLKKKANIIQNKP